MKKFLYHYKKKLPLPLMSYINNLNGFSKCGSEALELNAFITSEMSSKNLEFNVGSKDEKTKCKKMHIGKKGKVFKENEG